MDIISKLQYHYNLLSITICSSCRRGIRIPLIEAIEKDDDDDYDNIIKKHCLLFCCDHHIRYIRKYKETFEKKGNNNNFKSICDSSSVLQATTINEYLSNDFDILHTTYELVRMFDQKIGSVKAILEIANTIFNTMFANYDLVLDNSIDFITNKNLTCVLIGTANTGKKTPLLTIPILIGSDIYNRLCSRYIKQQLDLYYGCFYLNDPLYLVATVLDIDKVDSIITNYITKLIFPTTTTTNSICLPSNLILTKGSELTLTDIDSFSHSNISDKHTLSTESVIIQIIKECSITKAPRQHEIKMYTDGNIVIQFSDVRMYNKKGTIPVDINLFELLLYIDSELTLNDILRIPITKEYDLIFDPIFTKIKTDFNAELFQSKFTMIQQNISIDEIKPTILTEILKRLSIVDVKSLHFNIFTTIRNTILYIFERLVVCQHTGQGCNDCKSANKPYLIHYNQIVSNLIAIKSSIDMKSNTYSIDGYKKTITQKISVEQRNATHITVTKGCGGLYSDFLKGNYTSASMSPYICPLACKPSKSHYAGSLNISSFIVTTDYTVDVLNLLYKKFKKKYIASTNDTTALLLNDTFIFDIDKHNMDRFIEEINDLLIEHIMWTVTVYKDVFGAICILANNNRFVNMVFNAKRSLFILSSFHKNITDNTILDEFYRQLMYLPIVDLYKGGLLSFVDVRCGPIASDIKEAVQLDIPYFSICSTAHLSTFSIMNKDVVAVQRRQHQMKLSKQADYSIIQLIAGVNIHPGDGILINCYTPLFPPVNIKFNITGSNVTRKYSKVDEQIVYPNIIHQGTRILPDVYYNKSTGSVLSYKKNESILLTQIPTKNPATKCTLLPGKAKGLQYEYIKSSDCQFNPVYRCNGAVITLLMSYSALSKRNTKTDLIKECNVVNGIIKLYDVPIFISAIERNENRTDNKTCKYLDKYPNITPHSVISTRTPSMGFGNIPTIEWQVMPHMYGRHIADNINDIKCRICCGHIVTDIHQVYCLYCNQPLNVNVYISVNTCLYLAIYQCIGIRVNFDISLV